MLRIITQWKNVGWLRQQVLQEFGDFTLYKASGTWAGRSERTAVFEIIPAVPIPAVAVKLKRLCDKIKGYNRQECVLVETIPVEYKLY
jgi:hypothetical protein